MKVILRLDDNANDCTIYTSKRNLKDVMVELWEDQYNTLLADPESEEISEEDSWIDDDAAQIVLEGGCFVSEFKIIEVEEIK